MKYRSKVVEIEAVQLQFDNWPQLLDLAGTSLRGEGFKQLNAEEAIAAFPGVEFGRPLRDGALYASVPTRHGAVLAHQGDWIIRGTESELYPCEDSVFRRKYESAHAALRRTIERIDIDPALGAVIGIVQHQGRCIVGCQFGLLEYKRDDGRLPELLVLGGSGQPGNELFEVVPR